MSMMKIVFTDTLFKTYDVFWARNTGTVRLTEYNITIESHRSETLGLRNTINNSSLLANFAPRKKTTQSKLHSIKENNPFE